jgi:hypothetical protein
VTPDQPSAAEAIAHARDLLAYEDEHPSARLDDMERSVTVAELDDLIAWLGRAMVGPVRPRALEYRKLVAVQRAARAWREELVGRDGAPGGHPEAA